MTLEEKVAGVIGLLFFAVVAAISFFLVWLIGPFGPSIHSTVWKWVVSIIDFVAIAIVIASMARQLGFLTDLLLGLEWWLLEQGREHSERSESE